MSNVTSWNGHLNRLTRASPSAPSKLSCSQDPGLAPCWAVAGTLALLSVSLAPFLPGFWATLEPAHLIHRGRAFL